MSDIKLIVGIEENTSFRLFKEGVKRITTKLNKQNYKIKVDIDHENIKAFRSEIQEVLASMKSINSIGAFDSTVFKTLTKDFDSSIKKAEKLKAILNSTGIDNSIDLRIIDEKQKAYTDAYNKFKSNALTGNSSESEVQNLITLRSELDRYIASLQQRASAENAVAVSANKQASAIKKSQTIIKSLNYAKDNYTKAATGTTKDDYKNLELLEEELRDIEKLYLSGKISATEYADAIKGIEKRFNESVNKIKSAGENVKSFGDKFKNVVSTITQWRSAAEIFQIIKRVLREVFEQVKAIDAAMTELKKVTDATASQYDEFLINATNRAKKLGATLVDTINASADMARLGYNLDEASALADSALIYKNVGDGISDIDEASSSIISTMQAFGIEAKKSLQIVDKFNQAGNSFAISSGGIGDALLNSASALAAAGNSLDESIGMITAANTVVQDPQKVGTSLKTVSMYLRAAKTDAEAAGESTDGMAESVSKLRAEILQLTGGKVDIQLDEDTFKSTTQILRELSQVWDNLSDISQANILERIGGKRNSNVVSALIENFELVDEVIEKTGTSAGSALAENEKYLDSINGKIAQFQASFQDFSQSILDSELVKLVIDLGTLGMEGIDYLVDGISNLVKLIDHVPIGLEYIIPLLAIKKIGIFDKIKEFVSGKYTRLLQGTFDTLVGNIDKIIDSKKTIANFFKTPIGGLTATIAVLSLLTAAFKHLTEKAERAKQKLEDVKAEYSENKSELENLNKELEETQLRMYELLNLDSLTYVEQKELNKLKETNNELKREVALLEAKQDLLNRQQNIEFKNTAEADLENWWTSFVGLDPNDYVDNLFSGSKSDLMHTQISEYKTHRSNYNSVMDMALSADNEDNVELYELLARRDKEEFERAEKYLIEQAIQMQSIISGIDYGTDSVVNDYLDTYNNLIDAIYIALGYDDAEENAFSRLINETFDEVTDKFEDLGKDGKVTAKKLLKEYNDNDSFKGFIDSLIEVGYISDKTEADMKKVAVAFNTLGNEVSDSTDKVEDAFRRWEDAQNTVQSGAQFDSLIKALEHVYDTVGDKTSDIYAKIGNEDYKAAIELIVPEWKDVDTTNISEVKKYLGEIKKYFTFDDNGEYKGLRANQFLKDAVTAKVMEYDEANDYYRIAGKQTLESFAEGMGLSIPVVKAIIGEINEYGGDIHIFEYDEDFTILAKNAKSAAKSLEKSFDDINIDLDLTTAEDPIKYLDEKISELNKKRLDPKIDTTSANNLAKVIEYCVRQKQLLEQPAILMIDTTQVENESVAGAIGKLQKFVDLEREIELRTTLGHDTKELKKELKDITQEIVESSKDGGMALLGLSLDKKSEKKVSTQISEFITGVLSEDYLTGGNFGITEEAFRPALDSVTAIATKVDEIFNGERTLKVSVEKKNGVWTLNVNTDDLDSAEEKKEDLEKDSKLNLFLSNPGKFAVSLLEKLANTLTELTDKTHEIDVELNTTVNSDTGENSGGSNPIIDWFNNLFGGNSSQVNGTAHANGNWGFDGGEALVGELGQEIVVDPKTSSWYTVGDHGAEFVDIPKNAIIFNHKQTRSLLENGKIFGRGNALVGGTALNLTGGTGSIPEGVVGTQGKKSTDSSQIIDYIEILLSRLSRSLENFAKVADDTSKSFKERNKALEKQIDKTDSLITANQNAADAYLKKANSISLSSGIKEKVRNGSYDITKYDSDTAEKINQYKEYYEKYLEAKDEVNNQKSNKAALTMEQFDLIQSKYDSKYGYQDSRLDYQEALNEKYELLGQGGSLAAQDNSIEIYQNRVKFLKEEQEEYNKLLNSGAIKEKTEDWYKLKEAIANNKTEILETENAIEELNQKKIEIRFDRFEETREDYENKLSVEDNKVDYWEAVNNKAVAEGHGGSLTAQKEILAIHESRLTILKEEKAELEKQLKKIPTETDEWYEAKNAVQELNQEIVNTNTELIETKKNIDAINFERFQNVSVDYANKNIGIEDSIKRWEDVNTKMELLGDHGSVHAQDKMIEWNEAYIDSLRNELADMKDKWDKIDKDSQEYIDAEKAMREKQDQIRDAENQQLQYANNKRDILFSQYQDLQAEYDNKLGDIDHALSKVNHDIAMAESKGYKVSKSFYEDQKKLEQDRLNTIKEQYQEMKKHFEDAVSTGEIKEGSLEWYEYQKSLYAVEQSANDAELAIENLNQSIKDVDWENFKYLRDTIDELNDEADFYLELMSDEDMFDDKGNITEYGMASIGLRGQKYNTYMEEAAANSKKLKEIEEELAKDPANQKLIDQKKELTDAIYDNILAAKDQKQAMIDLVEDGINYELDALRDLIDEYKDALDKAKDLHDYEKKVNESTSEISSIKKQLSAYSGDDSQEAKLKIQKFQENLKKAEEELEETEYDRYISDQKELLDDFYDEYETNLNARLDDIDMVISKLITSVNQNSGAINETLNGLANEFGIELSEDMKNIWGDSKLGDILQHYIGENSDITRGQTTIVSVLGDIADKVDLIINASKNNSSSSVGSSSSLVGSTSYEKVRLDNAAVYANKGDSNPKYGSINSDYSFGVGNGTVPLYIKEIDGDWIGLSLTDNPNDPPVHWIKASDGNFRKYKNGGLVDYTGLAWVDGTKSNPEYMLNATDTENLMKLTDDLRKLYNGNITGSEIAQNASDIMRVIGLSSGVLTDINKTIGSAGNSIGDINITIPIERVQDYNDFVTQLKDDPKFDKLVKSLSLDLLDGKSRLAKNRINWNK